MIGHRFDHARLEAVLAAEFAQQVHIALGTLAEGEIASRHHAKGAKPLDQDLGNEILGAGARQLLVEVENQHRGRAGREVQLLPLLERGQAERRHIGAEESHRMRIEGGDNRWATLFMRPVDGLACDRLMPLVESIEIAERDHRAAQRLGDFLTVIEPAHYSSASALASS